MPKGQPQTFVAEDYGITYLGTADRLGDDRKEKPDLVRPSARLAEAERMPSPHPKAPLTPVMAVAPNSTARSRSSC